MKHQPMCDASGRLAASARGENEAAGGKVVQPLHYQIVAWYTSDYTPCFIRLRDSLAALGYTNLTGYQMEDTGRGWASNAMRKPQVLRRAFLDTDKDIVYLDADAIVHKRLALFDNLRDVDFAAHWRGERELLGGTQYWRNDPSMWALLDDMQSYMEAAHCFSQQALQALLPRRTELNILHLPPEYCCIFDTMRRQHSGIDPVIEHMQESRLARVRKGA